MVKAKRGNPYYIKGNAHATASNATFEKIVAARIELVGFNPESEIERLIVRYLTFLVDRTTNNYKTCFIEAFRKYALALMYDSH